MAAHSVVRMVALLGISLCSSGDIGREPRDIPHVDRAEPDVVQTGDIVSAFGKHLDWSHVADVLLGNADVLALTHIVEQESDFLRFRIPRSLAPCCYNILLTTTEQEPRLLDQQVVITVRWSAK
jgi:hypothetical protein